MGEPPRNRTLSATTSGKQRPQELSGSVSAVLVADAIQFAEPCG
jgi:hypothetical protein